MTKYFGTSSTSGPWDAVIIGSGMGAIVCGAIMARIGKRVLVLEQHYVPGGFTHVFKRQRWSWDVGVHVVGEVTEHTITGRLLKDLSRGQLEWQSLGPVYDTFRFPDGFTISFPDTREAFRDALITAFPSEEEAIDTYLYAVRAAVRAMGGFHIPRLLPPSVDRLIRPLVGRRARRLYSTTTAEVLDQITDNAKLKAVLTAQWGYYGLPPSRSSFAMHALVAKHYFYGGYYPVGGASRIADTILPSVVGAGGAVRVNAEVETIITRKGRAVGVRLTTGEEITAPLVISDAGAVNTARMLPEQERGWAEPFESLSPSPAHLCLYLGLAGDVRKAGATSANLWLYNSWDYDSMPDWTPESGEPPPCVYVSFPSLKDPEHDPGPEQLHTGEIVTFVPWGPFSRWVGTRWKKRGDDYEAFKQEVGQRMLERLLEYLPNLRPLVAHAELSTPLSTEHFARSHLGSIYGLEHSPERFAVSPLRPRTPIRGLFLTGCDVATGGVMGAAFGGVLTAAALEPRRTIQYLMPLARRR